MCPYGAVVEVGLGVALGIGVRVGRGVIDGVNVMVGEGVMDGVGVMIPLIEKILRTGSPYCPSVPKSWPL